MQRRVPPPFPLLRLPSLVLPLLFVVPSGAAAQTDRAVRTGAAVLSGPRLALTTATGEIRVDGRLDEPAWRAAPVATDFVQLEPLEGEPSSQATEVRVVHVGGALYISALLRDAEPEAIVARLARRDADVYSDWFAVYLDSYLDRRSAFGFAVNAAGVQRDVRISNDDARDASWDAVWESAVRVSAAGWTVELRIPLAQLRYTPGSVSEWGVNFERRVARSNETSHWAPVEPGSDRFVSVFGVLAGVAALPARRGIELVPYSAAGMTRDPSAADDPFRSRNEPRASAGADLRVGLGRGIDLAATLNPDFGQVEADPAQVNLSAFEIFQSERRPFFVEGAEIFELAIPSWPPLFYSRRIGRAPQTGAPGDAAFQDGPTATTILGAAKITGRLDGGWTFGALQALTQEERARYVDHQGAEGAVAVEPFTSHSVGRVARRFRGGGSSIGLLATAVRRDLSDDRFRALHSGAYAVALDGFHRFADQRWELRLGAVASHVRGDSAAMLGTQRAAGHYFQRPDASHVALDSGRTSLSGYSVTGRLSRIRGSWRGGLYGQVTSPGYEVADLGFNPTLDHGSAMAYVRYNHFEPGRRLRSWGAASNIGYQTTLDGERKELTQTLELSGELLSYWGGALWFMRHAPGWDPGQLRGGPALRKPGRWMGSVDAHSDRRRGVNGSARVFWEREDAGGGWRIHGSAAVTVRPSDRIDLRLSPFHTRGFDSWQYVGRQPLGTDGSVFLVGGLDQAVTGLTTRLDYTVSPDLSFQLYARPYLSAGRYSAIRSVADADSKAFERRFHTYAGDRLEMGIREDGRRLFRIDHDGDGAVDFERPAPDFNVRSFQLNAVARWQYRPGSTVFVVWSHDRNGSAPVAADLGRDLSALRGLTGRHTVMVKMTYWLGL